MTSDAPRRRTRLTMVDACLAVGALALVLAVVVPQWKVRAILRNEHAVVLELQELERLAEAHRASGATDADRDGKGEYAPLGSILAARESSFRQVDADVWERDGYLYAVLLPNRERRPVPGSSAQVVRDLAEVAELIVAWPAAPDRSGMRAYAKWPGGVLLQHTIDGYPYTRRPPAPDAPLVTVDADGTRPAERYDSQDWRPPIFNVAQRRLPE
jgi:hypothetical protein